MKGIYIFLIGILSIYLTSCSEDESMIQQLKVTQTQASFDCFGGKGSIRFTSSAPVSATSGAEWCQVSLNEGVISLEVAPNLDISSRTTMVQLTSGTEETLVPVSQLGDILYNDFQKNIDFSETGDEMEFTVKSNHDITFENVDKSWVTVLHNQDKVIIKAAPLNNAGIRENTILVKSGIHQMNLTLKQMNITGKYNCFSDGGKTDYGTCTIEATPEKGVYLVTPKGSAVDSPYLVTFSESILSIPFGQYLGKLASVPDFPFVYLCAYDKAGSLTWSSDASYEAQISNEGNKLIFAFHDNGSWSGQHIDGFYYGLFSDLLENGGSTTGKGIAAVVDLVWVSQ